MTSSTGRSPRARRAAWALGGLLSGPALLLSGVAPGLAPPAAHAGEEPGAEVSEDGTEAEPVLDPDDVTCESLQAESSVPEADSPNLPMLLMDVPEAQALLRERGVAAGEGVGIAVVDSGVEGTGLEVRERYDRTGEPELRDVHGTVVAGIAAGAPRPGAGGPVGVAPAASIVDVRVYTHADDGRGDPTAGVRIEDLVAGLTWLGQQVDRLGVDVVAIPIAVPAAGQGDAALERAVRRLVERHDLIVVAPTGNRPEPGQALFDALGLDPEERQPGEDIGGLLAPAAYAGVVGAGATADGSAAPDDPAAELLQSSDIDVVAPTYGAVSRGLSGDTCVVAQVATSWATGAVAGVVALLHSAYPDETDEQVLARLRHTARGAADQPTVLTGAGMVQPLEALTRPLHPGRDGEVSRSAGGRATPRATAPEPRADLLAETREDAVWWGLLGGGTLVLALVLRPLLTRRR